MSVKSDKSIVNTGWIESYALAKMYVINNNYYSFVQFMINNFFCDRKRIEFQ